VGALPGVWIGAHISSRAPDHLIRPLLAVVLIVSGLKMLGVGSLVVGVIGLVLLAGAVAVILRSSAAAAQRSGSSRPLKRAADRARAS